MENTNQKWAMFEEIDETVVVYGIGNTPDKAIMDAIAYGMTDAEPCYLVEIDEEIYNEINANGGGTGKFEFNGEKLVFI